MKRVYELIDLLAEYRPSSRWCDWAEKKDVSGDLSKDIKDLRKDLDSDIQYLKDYLRSPDSADRLSKLGPEGVPEKMKQQPEEYAKRIKDLEPKMKEEGVKYNEEVVLCLESMNKNIESLDLGRMNPLDPQEPQLYFGKLGGDSIKFKFTDTEQSAAKPLLSGHTCYLETIKSLEHGYKKGAHKAKKLLKDYYYAVWNCEPYEGRTAEPLKIIKCYNPRQGDAPIQYGEKVWIETTDGKLHLEHCGSDHPNYLGFRKIDGNPGQYWVKKRP